MSTLKRRALNDVLVKTQFNLSFILHHQPRLLPLTALSVAEIYAYQAAAQSHLSSCLIPSVVGSVSYQGSG